MNHANETAVREILRLEKARCEALVAGDIEALGKLVAEDLVHVHGNGHIDDKGSYLQGVKSKFRFHNVERGDLNIRIYNDVAVVVGPLDQTVSVIGTDRTNLMNAITVQTWVRSGGGWKQNTCQNQFLSITAA